MKQQFTDISKKLLTLIEECDTEFRKLCTQYGERICKDSIPILWFGDIGKYAKSETRIITFGLNPSTKEFDVPCKRFPDVDTLKNKCDADLYMENYNGYFENHCYCDWFCGYTDTLKRFGASFCSCLNLRNRVIHLDALSPIATADGWSDAWKNDKSFCKDLKNRTQHFFHDMIEICQPDILITHIGKAWLEEEKKSRNKQNVECKKATLPHFSVEKEQKGSFYSYRLGGRKIPILIIGNIRGKPASTTCCDLERQIKHHHLTDKLVEMASPCQKN